jgi:hypothetical protein
MAKNKTKKGEIDLVKERCILVIFGAGYYNWKRRDRVAEKEYSDSKGVRSDTFETKKNIFTGADAILNDIKSLVNETRAFHYDITLPWQHGHTATLANGLIPQYREKLAGFQNRMDQLNDSLKVEWPTMKKNAKGVLNGSFNEKDYPPIEKVIKSNYIRAKYTPVGTGSDIRSTVSGAEDPALDEIRKEIDADVKEAYDAAHQALWERLYEVLKVASKNLQKINSDDGRFRTEWYDNLSGLLSTLPHLNIHNDPRITEIQQEAEELLKYSPDVLTENVGRRIQTAKDADALFNKVSGIMGSF